MVPRPASVCPECHGALWEINEGDLLRFRCHVGHSYIADTVLEAQEGESEDMLGNLLRSHEERAALAQRMADLSQGSHKRAEELQRRAGEYADDARLVRQILDRIEGEQEDQTYRLQQSSSPKRKH